jgi:hypothetical protein
MKGVETVGEKIDEDVVKLAHNLSEAPSKRPGIRTTNPVSSPITF